MHKLFKINGITVLHPLNRAQIKEKIEKKQYSAQANYKNRHFYSSSDKLSKGLITDNYRKSSIANYSDAKPPIFILFRD